MSVLDYLLGRPLATAEESEQRIGVSAGIPMLGLDALSSAAYGPEAALTVLLPLGLAGLHYIGPIITLILILLFILYLSYRQTISAYPNGGGSYTVAKENLGVLFGVLAAASLLLDYILNVAVGISAGVEALVSAVPTFQPHILSVCLVILGMLTLVNLRGMRESGNAFIIPTYGFVGTLAIVLLIGLFKILASGGHPTPVEPPPALPTVAQAATLWVLMKSFASGCTAMTGVEAVSNGVTAFTEPRVETAQKTLTVIIFILALLLAGICFVCVEYGIGATDPNGAQYQSVISMIISAVVGRNWFYYVTQGFVLAVLALSANTSFAGFPRLCHLLAHDDFLPHSFAVRGRRLVYSTGIGILAGLSAVLLIIFGGITDRLIPLFAIGAFGAFTLSQAGMVRHWLRAEKKSPVSLVINGVGAVCTAIALGVVLVAKFGDGAWISCLVVPVFMVAFMATRRHYDWVKRQLDCPRAIETDPLPQPVVVVPIKGWNYLTEKALRFAMQLSDEVYAVQVLTDEDDGSDKLQEIWKKMVEEPLTCCGRQAPQLKILQSPYRMLFRPLFQFITELRDSHPTRYVAVIIPELVQEHWYDYPLHNKRAVGLKAALFFWGGSRVVVVNVPWYLGEPATT